MDITSPLINDYISLYTTEEDDVLRDLAMETVASVPGAQMLSGNQVGTFLSIISKLLHPTSILEIGTYTGYSAICLAKGLKEDGILHTIDNDDRWQEIRDKYWAQSGFSNKIKQHIGNANNILDTLDVSPELVFIDADKKSYATYFDQIIDKIKVGGIIIADNVLFKGEVTLPALELKNAAKAMHEFNIKIQEDNRVEQVILPLRDGISFIRKIK